jgi:hypothetical protein
MIYLMPIDECPHCGARTPRIISHRCSKQEENGHLDDKLAAEYQTWIASQLAISAQSRSPKPRVIDLVPAKCDTPGAADKRRVPAARPPGSAHVAPEAGRGPSAGQPAVM